MSSSTIITNLDALAAASNRAKTKYTELSNNIGTLANLNTLNKESVVSAINEVVENSSGDNYNGINVALIDTLDTDTLKFRSILNFNGLPIVDSISNMEWENTGVEISQTQVKYGSGSALFSGSESFLIGTPNPGVIYDLDRDTPTTNNVQDFDFFIYITDSTSNNTETTILDIKLDNNTSYGLKLSGYNVTMFSPTKQSGPLSIVTGQWNHLCFRFSFDSYCYLFLNGNENIIYLVSPDDGTNKNITEIEIGHFNGFINSFRYIKNIVGPSANATDYDERSIYPVPIQQTYIESVDTSSGEVKTLNGSLQVKGAPSDILEEMNPIIAQRELIIETDTNRIKIGDGFNNYTNIKYVASEDTITQGFNFKSILPENKVIRSALSFNNEYEDDVDSVTWSPDQGCILVDDGPLNNKSVKFENATTYLYGNFAKSDNIFKLGAEYNNDLVKILELDFFLKFGNELPEEIPTGEKYEIIRLIFPNDSYISFYFESTYDTRAITSEGKNEYLGNLALLDVNNFWNHIKLRVLPSGIYMFFNSKLIGYSSIDNTPTDQTIRQLRFGGFVGNISNFTYYTLTIPSDTYDIDDWDGYYTDRANNTEEALSINKVSYVPKKSNLGEPIRDTNGIIQLRGGDEKSLRTVNPLLGDREIMVETDTCRAKIGDGTRNWNSLPYITSNIEKQIGNVDSLDEDSLVESINNLTRKGIAFKGYYDIVEMAKETLVGYQYLAYFFNENNYFITYMKVENNTITDEFNYVTWKLMGNAYIENNKIMFPDTLSYLVGYSKNKLKIPKIVGDDIYHCYSISINASLDENNNDKFRNIVTFGKSINNADLLNSKIYAKMYKTSDNNIAINTLSGNSASSYSLNSLSGVYVVSFGPDDFVRAARMERDVSFSGEWMDETIIGNEIPINTIVIGGFTGSVDQVILFNADIDKGILDLTDSESVEALAGIIWRLGTRFAPVINYNCTQLKSHMILPGGWSTELERVNPVVETREIMIEENTGKFKIGTGTTWNSTPYAGIPLPPNDDKFYAMKNGEWVAINATSAN